MRAIRWISRLTIIRPSFFSLSSRKKSRWEREYLLDLWERRQLLGPDESKQRVFCAKWNYDVELYAFGKRLGEEFSEKNIRRAFLHRSYLEGQQKERSDLLLQSSSSSSSHTLSSLSSVEMEHNGELIRQGDKIISEYVKAYLRYHLPLFPEEGIIAVHDALTTNQRLAGLADQLGARELILANNSPHDDHVVADTLKAIVGALSLDQGNERTCWLVQDLVLTQLVGGDVNEMWYFKEPMKILTAYLEKKEQGTPERRIQRQSGSNSVTPTYVVGIYTNGILLGCSPGESVDIAVEMAARDSLIRLWKSNCIDFSFGSRGRKIDVRNHFEKPNWSLAEELSINVEADTTLYNEPLIPEQLTLIYKKRLEKTEGTPYRRKLWHRFYPGTLNRKSPRRFIAPKPTSI
uniref:Large ribosomal subunit protein mL44 n=1 Tax=Trichuris muris TaxID=70415 RepID=A0A5S6QGU0_TRIMR